MIVKEIQECIRTNLQRKFEYFKSQNVTKTERFESWISQFKFAHGDLDTQRKVERNKIEAIYGVAIENDNDLFLFIYCLDNFYGLALTLLCGKALDENYSANKIDDYLNFSFFKNKKVRNLRPPANLTFYKIASNFKAEYKQLADVIEKLPLEAASTTDHIREIYHAIFPREIRHALGAFYTPDWLAQYTVKKSNFSFKEKSLLDPTCGSGTFLIAISNEIKNQENGEAPLNRIFGIEINPLSAFAAKVNLVINNYSSLRKLTKDVFINVFQADVLDLKTQQSIVVKYNLNSIGDLQKIISEQETSDPKLTDKNLHYLELLESAAPALIKNIDHIMGNPPWVNWEYLPDSYREKTKHIWQDYGLFDHKGFNSSFIKEDISALITYVSIDRFLKDQGTLSFVLKESLLKSSQQASGFRKFSLKNRGTPINAFMAEDLTAFKPFSGVNNKTILLYLLKGKETQYPVEYVYWKPIGKKTFLDTDNLQDVLSNFEFDVKAASPIDPKEPASSWSSVSQKLNQDKDQLIGQCSYKARTGVFTGGANGIYWLNIQSKTKNNLVKINNIVERAKIKFEKIDLEVETNFIFPYMSGSELGFWQSTYKKYILCPHTSESKMYPINEEELKKNHPHSWKFFKYFENELKSRKGFTSFDKKIHEENFYALQRIGDYTFSPYKVAWKYISTSFTCAVIKDVEDKYLGRKTVIPNEKIIYIGLEDELEAFYLCGILSSTRMRELIDSFKISTQIAPSIINNLNIPKFNWENPAHLAISNACKEGHLSQKNLEKYVQIIDNNLESALSNYKYTTALPAETGVQAEFTF